MNWQHGKYQCQQGTSFMDKPCSYMLAAAEEKSAFVSFLSWKRSILVFFYIVQKKQ